MRLHEKQFKYDVAFVPLFPRAFKTIKCLFVRRNLSLFASSGMLSPLLDARFKKAKIFDYFQMILGSDVIPKSPIHIEIFAKATKLSGSEFVKRAIYIGDGPQDMNIAKGCGIRAIGVATTVSAEKLHESGADAIIKELDILELKKVLT